MGKGLVIAGWFELAAVRRPAERAPEMGTRVAPCARPHRPTGVVSHMSAAQLRIAHPRPHTVALPRLDSTLPLL